MLPDTVSILRQRRYKGPKPPSRLRCLCLCQCGQKFFAWRAHLVSGNTKSCGCLRNSRTGKSAGLMSEAYSSTQHPLNWMYLRWMSMWDRCTRETHVAYHRYGGRGIKVCDRWKDFESFLADVGVPADRKLTLDRENNEKGYEPGNCRWATPKQQRANQTPRTPKPPRAKKTPEPLPDDWLDGLLPK